MTSLFVCDHIRRGRDMKERWLRHYSRLLAACTLLLCALLCAGAAARLHAQAGDPAADPTHDFCQDSCCQTDVLLLNSGYDHLSRQVYDVPGKDDYWSVTKDGDNTDNLPRAADVIAAADGWAKAAPNSGWIGTNPGGTSNGGNVLFEKCFCVCGPDPATITITLDIMAGGSSKVHLDGATIATIPDKHLTGPVTVTYTTQVTPGQHCIQVEVNGAATTDGGINIQGQVQGKGLLKYNCCHPPLIDLNPCQTDKLTLVTNSSWTLTSGPAGLTYPRCVVDIPNGYPGWSAPMSGTGWIGSEVAADGTASENSAAGNYVYHKCFCVDRAGTFIITISMLADNQVSAALNGTLLFSHVGFQNPPTTQTFFVGLAAGCNCFDFTVNNWGGPTGLDASIDIHGGLLEKESCCSCSGCAAGGGGDPQGRAHARDGGAGISAVLPNIGADAQARPMLMSVPNPATGEAMVHYTIDHDANARLVLYNSAGKRALVIDEGAQARGAHAVPMDTRGLPAGAYHLQLIYGTNTLAIPVTVQ